MTPRIGSPCPGVGNLDLAIIDAPGGGIAWHAQLKALGDDVVSQQGARAICMLLNSAGFGLAERERAA